MSHADLINELKPAAKKASQRAYAPYSNLRIGAAVQMADGAIHTGCNIENASFSLCICAERVALSSAISTLGAEAAIVACLVYTSGDQVLSPCGACRQFMSEFMPADASIFSVCDNDTTKHWHMHDLLPAQFTFPARDNGSPDSC